MKNKLDLLFRKKKERILNMYCTAGFPELDSTAEVVLSLQNNGADIIEIGMPYSDPIADGPVIQQSNAHALENGISILKILDQLNDLKTEVNVPLILMGYLNPVLQYGFERFCTEASAAGVSGLILPDMPVEAFDNVYKKILEKHNLHLIFLVTPATNSERIKALDKRSKGFLYAVSSAGTTGNSLDLQAQESYFKRLCEMRLKNPVLIGFSISNKESFDAACKYASGAIIGSAYIKRLITAQDINVATRDFLAPILAQ